MTHNKNILVLYADAGFGHRTAALAVTAAINEMYGSSCTVEMVNPLDDHRTPLMLRDSQTDYDRLVRRMPELYKLGYVASDATVPTALVESGLILLLYEVIHDVIKRYQPDLVISTYPLYQAPLDAVFTLGRTRAPVILIVTDLATVHRLWFNDRVSLCMVPSQKVYDLAIDSGMAPEQVKITGIPVSPDLFKESRSREAIRATLGWQAERKTILAVGSKRVDGLAEALHVINHSGFPLQLAVVAGGDEDLYHQLQEMEWHAVTHLYNYVNNMHELMNAADIILCKPGGLIVTEALACGRPMLLIGTLPGQEKGNAEYVVEGGAGEMGPDPIGVLETLCHWLEHGGALLEQRSAAAARLGTPRAAYDVAQIAWEAAQRGLQRKHTRPLIRRERLLGLFDSNKVKY